MKNNNHNHESYWEKIWNQFLRHRLGPVALCVVILFCLVGIYAPFLASSKPLVVKYDGQWFFPLFHYLFFTGFYTKLIDIFFNLMMFTLPMCLVAFLSLKKYVRLRKNVIGLILVIHMGIFFYIAYQTPKDPAADLTLIQQRQSALKERKAKQLRPDWKFNLKYMNSYAKLNRVLRYRHRQAQHEHLQKYSENYAAFAEQRWLKEVMKKKRAELPSDPEILEQIRAMPTLWQMEQENEKERIEIQKKFIEELESEGKKDSKEYQRAQYTLQYILDRKKWLENENAKIQFEVMPLLRPFHWEDDAGGEQSLNLYLPWWELTRITRKDLVAALIFGVRISLVVGIMAVSLAMMIGIPIGSLAGYYGGKFDIILSRLLEIWESMPTFFMLLLVVAMTQSKSIFLVIAVVGIFGWTSFSRYIRGEFFKQRNLPYVEACHALGFRDTHIMFTHILPNAIPPVLTLLPFAIMGAITSEAGLSFLGLGEEGSCSWGVLMDEGRTAFPGESYLLWPPAILLTLLLVAIALVGDALRDALDPKMYR